MKLPKLKLLISTTNYSDWKLCTLSECDRLFKSDKTVEYYHMNIGFYSLF